MVRKTLSNAGVDPYYHILGSMKYTITAVIRSKYNDIIYGLGYNPTLSLTFYNNLILIINGSLSP